MYCNMLYAEYENLWRLFKKNMFKEKISEYKCCQSDLYCENFAFLMIHEASYKFSVELNILWEIYNKIVESMKIYRNVRKVYIYISSLNHIYFFKF